jgi:tRNA U34 5-methylaminomethyl-2-thiouridine-forming methyltransferase MnmC
MLSWNRAASPINLIATRYEDVVEAREARNRGAEVGHHPTFGPAQRPDIWVAPV